MQKLAKYSLIVVAALLILNGLLNIIDDGRILSYDITSILSGIGFGVVSFLLQKNHKLILNTIIVNKKISDYFSKQDFKQKEVLIKIRELIKKLLPNAEERMSYGVPSFRLQGKSILYAAFKKHVGLYPDPSIIEFFSDDLKEYETSKGTIKFDLEKPIPFNLIEKIIKYKYGL